MKLTPEDPRLSAYLLGELSAEEAAEVDRAVAADPAVRVSLNELQKTMNFLSGVLGGPTEEKLLPAQRQAVLRAGRDADDAGKVVEFVSAKKSIRPWLTGMAAAAAIAFAAVLLNQMGGERGGATNEWADEIALLPMPGPGGAEGLTNPAKGTAVEFEMQRQVEQRGSAFLGEVARKLEQVRLPEVDRLPAPTNLSDFSEAASVRLPVLVGKSSPVWVNRWMQEHGELPPKRLVRVEEFINSVSLRTTDEFAGLGYGWAVMDCPWNADSRLVAVQVSAGNASVKDLELTSVSTQPRRVLGSFSRRSDESLPTVLPAGTRTLVMMEVRANAASLGELQIRHGGSDRVLSFPFPDEEMAVSAEMARAVTMAGYALWLRGEIESEEWLRTIDRARVVDPGAIHRELQRSIELAKSLAEAGR
ncbi:von Willebrand factor type A domain-containing protein [Haloferula rosea]|uniref:von Willebrand factor type A domain-containing protein n=1 Tax=Haloferula rosea TaxID=490093 RepID=A0A934RAM1_9BACT|nr:von Willebrand factor type A domain-containing protein [Haloferula rosea]MBK1825849.1 von Willebrand factor type A domain-containing protein [Haloferula rosea]